MAIIVAYLIASWVARGTAAVRVAAKSGLEEYNGRVLGYGYGTSVVGPSTCVVEYGVIVIAAALDARPRKIVIIAAVAAPTTTSIRTNRPTSRKEFSDFITFLHFFVLWVLIVDICTPVHSLPAGGIAGQGSRKQLESFPGVVVSITAVVFTA
jgi:hypothetical protein